MKATKERPILFSGPMVRAILAGTKTQTRRVVKPPHSWVTPYADGDKAKAFELFHAEVTGGFWIAADLNWDTGDHWQCGDERLSPNYLPGDRLWVKETFAETDNGRFYRADGEEFLDADGGIFSGPWKPSIFMPRWASRLTLEITSVRVERLQDITEEDAIAEGVEKLSHGFRDYSGKLDAQLGQATTSYATLWESINGSGSWNVNPWVWAIEFKRITA